METIILIIWIILSFIILFFLHRLFNGYFSYGYRFNKKALKVSKKGGYKIKKLLNHSEQKILLQLQKKLLATDYFCFPQIALGEILDNKNKSAFYAINCKRSDFCIFDKNFTPIAIIEFNGSGHWLSVDVKKRDEIKKQASENAGLLYFTISSLNGLSDRLDFILSKTID